MGVRPLETRSCAADQGRCTKPARIVHLLGTPNWTWDATTSSPDSQLSCRRMTKSPLTGRRVDRVSRFATIRSRGVTGNSSGGWRKWNLFVPNQQKEPPMSHESHRPSSRLRSVLLAGALVGFSVVSGATSAEATPNVTDLEGTALRIGGAAVPRNTTIPAGRTLTPVRLTTSDPSTFQGDGYSLAGAVAEVRTRRFTIPGSPAESVTFTIDGSVVATSVPDLFFTGLQTDAGVLPAIVFTASGVTYAISTQPVEAATRTTAEPTSIRPATSAVTHAYGLLPVGAQPRTGDAYNRVTNFGTPGGAGVTRVTVLDADDIRGNADTAEEELAVRGNPAPRYPGRIYVQGVEVVATVTLRSGATLSLNALSYRETGAYSYVSTTWLFDRSALTAAGATVADITGVISEVPSSHSLTWQELGLDLA